MSENINIFLQALENLENDALKFEEKYQKIYKSNKQNPEIEKKIQKYQEYLLFIHNTLREKLLIFNPSYPSKIKKNQIFKKSPLGFLSTTEGRSSTSSITFYFKMINYCKGRNPNDSRFSLSIFHPPQMILRKNLENEIDIIIESSGII